MRHELLIGREKFDELRPAWQVLVNSSASATPFQTYEWQSLWWKHFGRGTPMFFTAWEGNDLVGLYPLVQTGGLWRVVRPMGVGPSDYLAPLSRTGFELALAEEFVDFLAHDKSFDLVDLHQVRETSALSAVANSQLRGSAILEQARCLQIALPDRFESYLATLGKSLRYDIRQSRRGDRRGVALNDCNDENVLGGINAFFDLHQRRWRARGLPGAFFKRSMAFHREWAVEAARKGWLRLSLLINHGQPIGAIYGMILGESTYYYQAGFDPDHRKLGPGTTLIAHLIDRAIQDGCTHFDLMRGDEPYKNRWKPTQMVRNLRYVSPGRTRLGQIGSDWNQFSSRVEAQLRQRLEGKGLW